MAVFLAGPTLIDRCSFACFTSLMRNWLDWALGWWLRLRGNRLARNAGYLILAAIAAVSNAVQLIIVGIFSVFGQTITTPETPWWVVVLFIATAAVLLIVDRLRPAASPPPNPHDAQLFKRFRELFDDDVMHFLRTHDFGGGSFHVKYFNTFNEISAAWIGGRHQFDDPEMAKIWDELFTKNRELARLIALNTTPPRGRADLCQPHWFDEDWHSPKTRDLVKTMNDTATELAEHIDRLEVAARTKRISTPNV